MIDMENQLIKDTIEDIKYKLQKQILDCFEFIVSPLWKGELHEGYYEFICSYRCKGGDFLEAIEDLYLNMKVRISEADYVKLAEKGIHKV